MLMILIQQRKIVQNNIEFISHKKKVIRKQFYLEQNRIEMKSFLQFHKRILSNRIHIMSFLLHTIPFPEQARAYLQTRLLSEYSQASLLLQLLIASDEHFEQQLILVTQQLSLLQSYLSFKSKQLYWLALSERLNKWQPSKITDGRELGLHLCALQRSFCSSAVMEGELMAYLALKLDIKAAYQLLEHKFIGEWFNLSGLKATRQALEELLTKYFKQLTDPNSSLPQLVSPAQTTIYLAKTIKLQSWMFGLDYLVDIDLEQSFREFLLSQSVETLKEVLQIRHDRSYQIFSSLMARVEGEDKPTNWFLSDTLLNVVLPNYGGRLDVFEIFKLEEQHKSIVFRFNILDLPSRVFSNFLPHDLLGACRDSLEKREKDFKQMTGKLQGLLEKLTSGWAFGALSYQKGKVSRVSYSEHEKAGVIARCLQVWQNILKLIWHLPTPSCQPKKISYKAYFNSSQMQYSRVVQTLLKVLKLEICSHLHLNIISYLIMQLARELTSSFRKIFSQPQFMTLLVDRIIKLIDLSLPKIQVVHILELVSSKWGAIQDVGLSNEKHPLNQLNVCQTLLAFHLSLPESQFSLDNSISIFAPRWPYTLTDEFLLDQVPFSRFAVLCQLLEARMVQLTEKLSQEPYNLSRIGQIRLRLLSKWLMTDGAKADLGENCARMIRQIVKKRLIYQLMGDSVSSNSLVCLFISALSSEIEATAETLLTELASPQIIELQQESATSPFHPLSPALRQAHQSMAYFIVLLKVAASQISKQSLPLFFNILKLIPPLTRLKMQTNQLCLHMLSSLSASKFRSLIMDEDKLKTQTKNVQIRESYEVVGVIDAVTSQMIKFICSLNKLDYCQYLAKVSFLLDQIISTQSEFQAAEYLSFVISLLSQAQRISKCRMGLIFLVCFRSKLPAIVKNILSYCKSTNKKPRHSCPTLQAYKQRSRLLESIAAEQGGQELLQRHRDEKQCYLLFALEAVLLQVYTVGSVNSICVNDKIYQGNQNLARIQRSILKMALEQIKQDFDEKLAYFYHLVLINGFQIARRLQDRPLISQVETPSGILLLNQLTILPRNYDRRKMDQLILECIKCFLQAYHRNSGVLLRQSAQILYNNIANKQHFQAQIKSILYLLLQSLEDIMDRRQTDAFKLAIDWVNQFLLDFMQQPIGSVFQPSFVTSFLSFFPLMLEPLSPEGLSASAMLLSLLLPDCYNADQNLSLLHLARYIAKIFVIIAKTAPSTTVSASIFQSVICKIMKSKDQKLLKYAGVLICTVKNIRFAGIICKGVNQNYLKANLQAEIKTYLLLRLQRGFWKELSSINLCDFSYQFRAKYNASAEQLALVAGELLLKKTTREGDIDLIDVIPHPSIDYAYSNYLSRQFLHFSPPNYLLFALAIRVQAIVDDFAGNTRHLKDLQQIIYNCPLLLPAIAMQPVVVEKQEQIFLHFLIRKAIMLCDSQTRRFILFLCLDHSFVIKANSKPILASDVICRQIVSQLLQQPLHSPSSLMIVLYLVQIRRFAFYAGLPRNSSLSLREKIENIFIGIKENDVKDNQMRLLCSVILSILAQYQAMRALQRTAIPNFTSRSFPSNITDTCTFPFDGLLTPLLADEIAQPEKVQQENPFEVESLVQSGKLKLIEAYSQVVLHPTDFQDQQQSREIHKVDEDVLGRLITTKTELGIISLPDLESKIAQNFNNLMWVLERWIIKGEQLKRVQKPTLFYSRTLDQSPVDGLEIAFFNWMRIGGFEPSRYAAYDFQRSHIHNPPDFLLNIGFSETIISHLKEFTEKPSERFMAESAAITEQARQLLCRINSNYQLLSKPPIDCIELKQSTHQQLLDWLRTKQLESEFDLKEKILSNHQFQQYCLHNLTHLERLQSGRRKKVRKIEEQMILPLLTCTQSDSTDHVIDVIDENYQLLPSLSRGYSARAGFRGPEVHEHKWIVPRNCQASREIFPDIHEELLKEMVLMVYWTVPGFRSQNYVVLLENKNVRSKVINTLLYIYRNPLENKLLSSSGRSLQAFPKSSAESLQIDIRKSIINLLLSFPSLSFYRDSTYLMQPISFLAIGGIMLDPLPSLEGFCPKETHIPIYQVILYALDIATYKLQDSVIFKLLTQLKKAPSIIINKIVEYLCSLNKLYDTSPENADKFNFISLKVNLNVGASLKKICEYEPFKSRIKEVSPADSPTLNPFLLGCLVPAGIYSREELNLMYNTALGSSVKKFDTLFFLNEMLTCFSQEELRLKKWMSCQMEAYQLVLKMYLLKTKNITVEQCYRLLDNREFSLGLSLQLRTSLFNAQISALQNKLGLTGHNPKVYARRKNGIFFSAFEDLRHRTTYFWLSRFSLRFVDSHGKMETGVGVGVHKDWYTLLTRDMVNLDYALFTKSSKNYYFFNRESWVNPRHLQFFEFIGKIFALSLTQRQKYSLCPSFSILIYKMILGQSITVDDLVEEFDQGLMLSNLEKLRQFTDDSLFWQSFVYEDVQLLSHSRISQITEECTQQSHHYLVKETISIDEGDHENSPQRIAKAYKVCSVVQLVPGGSNIPVNLDNLDDYIRLTRQKIYDVVVGSVSRQATAFIEGFRKVIDINLLQKFSPQELRMMAEGTSEVSVSELKSQTELKGFQPTDKPIQLLWSVLQELSPEERSLFIQHWTGAPKIPAGGVTEMKLRIVKIKTGKRIYAQTCFNQINLPEFSTLEQVREGVLTAVNSLKFGVSALED